MPEMLTIRVIQEREIYVTANSLEDGISIAAADLNGTEPPLRSDGTEMWGRVTRKVKQTSLLADLE